jgi:hypothetical protein
VSAANLADISNRDAVAGLKDALVKGSQAAVAKLGVEDGFMKSVRIGLPPSLRSAEAVIRTIGMGTRRRARAARPQQAATPQARRLLTDAARNMSVKDARHPHRRRGLRRSISSERRRSRWQGTFRPIVARAMKKVTRGKVRDRRKRREIRAREGRGREPGYVARKTLDGSS